MLPNRQFYLPISVFLLLEPVVSYSFLSFRLVRAEVYNSSFLVGVFFCFLGGGVSPSYTGLSICCKINKKLKCQKSEVRNGNMFTVKVTVFSGTDGGLSDGDTWLFSTHTAFLQLIRSSDIKFDK